MDVTRRGVLAGVVAMAAVGSVGSDARGLPPEGADLPDMPVGSRFLGRWDCWIPECIRGYDLVFDLYRVPEIAHIPAFYALVPVSKDAREVAQGRWAVVSETETGDSNIDLLHGLYLTVFEAARAIPSRDPAFSVQDVMRRKDGARVVS